MIEGETKKMETYTNKEAFSDGVKNTQQEDCNICNW
jgi:hypothetical protein